MELNEKINFLEKDPLGFLKEFENDKELVIKCVKDSSDAVKECINGFVELGFLEKQITELGDWFIPTLYFDKMLVFQAKEGA
jgi:ribosomal protein S17E